MFKSYCQCMESETGGLPIESELPTVYTFWLGIDKGCIEKQCSI